MNTKQTSKTIPLFPLGDCCMTSGVAKLVSQQSLSIQDYLLRHQCGDWGTVGKEDAAENELSLKEGYRLLSAYEILQQGGNDEKTATIKIWIITEADRSTTTILLPNEY